MPSICHLWDETAGWEQRLGVSQLLERLPVRDYPQTLATVNPIAIAPLRELGRRVNGFCRIAGLNASAAPLLARFVEQNQIDVIHAWGVHAAAVARAASKKPLVIELFDPVVATREIKLLRSLARTQAFAVVCSCGIVRRRLIEGGLAPELCVVVRPGVDFGLIQQSRRRPLRDELGIASEDFVILVPEPATRCGGHSEAFWAGRLLNHLSGHVKVIVPGESREQRRIARFAAALPPPPTLICPGARVAFEELVPIADTLVVASRADISTTAIAWAMAAKVAVIGSAVHAVAELITHKVGGLLYKQPPGKRMTTTLVKLLQDRPAQERTKEVAGGQAYEVFSLRRAVEQRIKVYENVLAGVSPGMRIIDSAEMG
jgi:glycosyltransferase involved in cell wall biosynthesis